MSLTSLAFLTTYFGGVIASLVRGPMYGLCLYIFVFYAHPPSRWWRNEIPGLRWSLIASLALLISVLIYKNKQHLPNRPKWSASPIIKLLIIYTLWMWLQSFWAISPGDHAYGRELYTKFIILMVCIYVIVNNEERLRIFAFSHVVGCFYLGWLAWESGKSGVGAGGPGINTSNNLAVHLDTGVMFGAMLLLSTDKRIRMVSFLALPFILNGIVLTGSRGGFLALVAGGIALYYLSPISKKKQIRIYALLGIVLFGVLAGEKFTARMDTIFIDETEERDGSAESRYFIAAAQWKIFTGHLMGTGHRGTKTLSYKYLDKSFLDGGSRSSHNLYLTVLVDQGIPGAIIYIILMATAVRTVIRLKADFTRQGNEEMLLLNAAVGASLVSIAISGLFSALWRMEVTFWVLTMLMILMSFSSEHQMEKDKPDIQASKKPPRMK